MNPMRLLILLIVTGTTGSILFATDPVGSAKQGATGSSQSATTQPPAPSAREAVNDKVAVEGEKEPDQDVAASAANQNASETQAADEDADPAPLSNSNAAAVDAEASSPQRFVPSEEVRADFDVSFPIDI